MLLSTFNVLDEYLNSSNNKETLFIYTTCFFVVVVVCCFFFKFSNIHGGKYLNVGQKLKHINCL